MLPSPHAGDARVSHGLWPKCCRLPCAQSIMSCGRSLPRNAGEVDCFELGENNCWNGASLSSHLGGACPVAELIWFAMCFCKTPLRAVA